MFAPCLRLIDEEAGIDMATDRNAKGFDPRKHLVELTLGAVAIVSFFTAAASLASALTLAGGVN